MRCIGRNSPCIHKFTILFLKFTYNAFVKTMKFSFKFANCCSISILRCILAYLKSISGCLSMVSLPFFFLLLQRFPFQLNQYKQHQYLLIYIYWFLRWLLKKQLKSTWSFQYSFWASNDQLYLRAQFKRKKHFTNILLNLQRYKWYLIQVRILPV